jgi:amino acid adenylation domain-containing protein
MTTPSNPNVKLSPAKRALLDRLRNTSAAELDRIPKQASGLGTVSYQQRQIWLLEQAHGSAPHPYNQCASLSLTGPLLLSAFEQALAALVRRHEALRTRFELIDGELVATIAEPAPVPLHRVDHLGVEDGAARDAVLDAVARDEGLQRFDLSRGPLFRAKLLRFADDQHTVVLTWHHIAIDGLSLRIVIDELAALYAALVEGREPTLAEPELQYGDFAAYQRERLTEDRLERELAYWKSELAGELPNLDLPLDRARSSARSYRGARQTIGISPALAIAIKELARAHHTTPFTVLLAAYNVLLRRYTGQADFLVGVPNAGRLHRDTAGLVGCFVNTLVYRARVPHGTSFALLLAAVRDTAVRAMANQEVPLELLVAALGVRREAGQNAVFQTLFGYQDRLPEASAGGLRFGDVVMRNAGTSKFDLEMNVFENESGLLACFDYDTDVLRPPTVRRMLHHYLAILTAACRDPDCNVDRLPLLSSIEHDQIVVGWNATTIAYPSERCVHELFETQVDRTPDRTAVVFESEQVTYRELDERANQLAHYLRARGVGTGAIVALLLDRSIGMMVAILGVLKAGAAYLPLDVECPPDRLAFMLRDAGASIVVAQRSRDPMMASGPEPERVYLDADRAAIASEPRTRVTSGATVDDLIYVMYTSGSTGQPKGVMLQHGGVTNRIVAMQQAYVTSDDVVLQKTPYTFDVAVGESFCPLVIGATLVMARPHGHRDPSYLARVIEQHGVTFTEFVPSMLQLFLSEPSVAERCGSLRTVIASGEVLAPDLAQRFCTVLAADLVNVYGPTEAGEVTAWRYEPGVSSSRLELPLGRPMPNFRIHILDSLRQATPVGVRGEIHIGGVGVARGYLGRPDLTAERFVPDPFGPPGSRQYKTGDLGRYTSDGLLEYVGRADSQIKIRGVRVELGEIEAVLSKHHGVREAVVIAREERPGDKRLVAYVTATADGAFDMPSLRAHAERALPDVMIPATIVVLDALPLTPTGKVDRRALPVPAPVDVRGVVDGTNASLTETERKLLVIWREVLGLESIGVGDDFFECGANSLLMIQAASRIREEFGIELDQEVLFELPTVRDLGERIDAILAKMRDLVASIPVTEEAIREAHAIIADPGSSHMARTGARKFLEVIGRDQD